MLPSRAIGSKYKLSDTSLIQALWTTDSKQMILKCFEASRCQSFLPDWWLLQASLPPNFLFLSPFASFVSLKASWSCNRIQYTVTPALFSPESMNTLNCKCCDPKYLWLRFTNVWYIYHFMYKGEIFSINCKCLMEQSLFTQSPDIHS